MLKTSLIHRERASERVMVSWLWPLDPVSCAACCRTSASGRSSQTHVRMVSNARRNAVDSGPRSSPASTPRWACPWTPGRRATRSCPTCRGCGPAPTMLTKSASSARGIVFPCIILGQHVMKACFHFGRIFMGFETTSFDEN